MEQEQPCCSQCWNARTACNCNEISLQQEEEEERSCIYCLFHLGGTSWRGGSSQEELRRLQLIDFIDDALDLIDNDDHMQDNMIVQSGNITTATTRAPSVSLSYNYPCGSSRTAALSWTDFFEQPHGSSSESLLDELVPLADCCEDDYDGDLAPPRMIMSRHPTRTRSTTGTTAVQQGNTPIIEQDANSTNTEEEPPSSFTITCSRKNMNHQG